MGEPVFRIFYVTLLDLLCFRIKLFLLMQLRNPKEVTTDEYNEFYKKTFNDYLDPLASSHFTTEVTHFPSDINIYFCL